MNPKQRLGEEALQFIHSGMIVGLGTGSTADFFLIALGEALRSGKLRNLRGVPTSLQTERRATELGIPLIAPGRDLRMDVTVDGADEVDPQCNLIKGLGGALLREKIIAQNSARLVIIADDSKMVPVLGSKCPLPVEVVQFAREAHEEFFRELGATASLRQTRDGKTLITDNGNVIYDLRFARIDDPAAMEQKLHRRAGVVETGLFVGMADVVLVGKPDGTVQQQRR